MLAPNCDAADSPSAKPAAPNFPAPNRPRQTVLSEEQLQHMYHNICVSMSLTQEEMVDMVFVLGACHRNPLYALRVYAQRYSDRRHPRKYYFQLVLDRFVNTGSIEHIKQNRPNTIVTEENKFLVLGCIQENPETSVRQISHTTGISATSVHRIITKHKYHPYHIQLHQELLDVDFPRREAFLSVGT
ncbi:hypothetical protein NQ318_022559 [Aromia moschata]|uniref:DUF4817 domain-containing protein n=1 Tax=Aromia moschata TaxID=1265417 RepID=A0AAV8X3N5_9CUCU|nr:hypothetical protein NQ318_022559 [Aromia moschata]